MSAKRKALKEKLETQLKEWDVEIALLRDKAEKAQKLAVSEYYATIEALAKKREDAKIKLQELKSGGPGTWEELKTGTEHIWDEVKTAVHTAASKFK